MVESNLYVRVAGLWINRLGDEFSPPTPEPAFTIYDSLIHGGGTHNAGNYSPDGSHLAVFADVGGTRYHTDADGWRYMLANDNAERQVAGGIIMNDGTVLALAGNGTTAGKLIEITPDGTLTVLVSGLYVLGNAPGDDDVEPRPRPVGNMVAYDATNDIVYVCEQDGVLRYNRGTSSNDGRIALDGVSCRGFAHTNDGHVNGADTLVVATQTVGLVKLFDVRGETIAVRISDQGWDRFEDAAIITGDKLLATGYATGVYRYDATGAVTLNGSQKITGPSASYPNKGYELVFYASNLAWSTAACDLFGNWHAGDTAQQQHRFSLEGSGVLRYRTQTGSGISSITADAAITLADGPGWVKVVRDVTSNDTSFWESTDGIAWVQVGTTASQSAVPQSVAAQWNIGATINNTGYAPSGTAICRAWFRYTGSSTPQVSFDATGLVTGATTYQSLDGATWTLNGTVTVGGVDVTPSQNSGTGANGGTITWVTAACIDIGATVAAAIGYINPDSATEWIYRSLDAEAVTAGAWENATPTVATQEEGSGYLEPANRIIGSSGGSGAGLVGVYYLAFDPSDTTGNTLFVSGPLAVYRSTNFAGTLASITYTTFQQGLSVVTAVDAHIDASGNLLLGMGDHDSMSVASADAFTVEPTRGSISGTGAGWGIFSVGTGASKVSVIAAADPGVALATDQDVYFHKGSGIPTSWTSTGFTADLGTHRPGGCFGWDNGDGTYTFVVWGDGTGWSRSTVTVATNSWTTWTSDTGTPTSTSDSQHQVRPIVGKVDGSILWAIELKTGDLYRYSGGSWSIRHNAGTPSFGTAQQVRTGRLAYYEAEDWLICSDGNGLYRVSSASGSSSITQITGIDAACIVAVDYDGLAYAHERATGKLWRFDDFATAVSTADAEDIANNEYRTRCPDLATQITVGDVNGAKTGVTLYQGAGAIGWN